MLDFLMSLKPNLNTIFWAILTVLAKHYWDKYQKKADKIVESDKKRVQIFLSEMPDHAWIKEWFDIQNFDNAFETETFHYFKNTVEEYTDNPHKVLSSKKANEILQNLRQLNTELSRRIGNDTFPKRGSSNLQTIRRMKYGDAIDDFETSRFLNEKSTEIFQKHEKLINIFRAQGLMD